MKNVHSWRKALGCFLWVLFVAMATVTSAAAQSVVVPVMGTTPTLTSVTINSSPGDQSNPHVSGDWATYTDYLAIRYYNFSTGVDAQIPLGASARDLLSDISGSKIVFSRMITGVKTAVMVFDAATPWVAPLEIDPALGTTRLGSAIGGDTVAYIDYGLEGNGELVIHDLVSNTSVRITNDTFYDQNPSVSPDGDVVTWEHCASNTNCDIWQAVKSGATWNVSAVADSASPEGNPDSNGALVVYDSQRGPESDLFWRAVAGGAETQLQMAGYQFNPSIAGDFIAFESQPTLLDYTDIFVYDIVNNRLFQITNTPLVNEELNDITLLPDGSLRVVWASDEDGQLQRNIRAATFRLPNGDVTPPVLTVPADLTVNATSPSGAVVSYVVTATDAVDPSPTVSCAPVSGSSFSIGTTVVMCTATDASGNSSYASFNVTVKGASGQIADLIALVTSFNLRQGITNSLDAKLQNVLAALTAAGVGDIATACNKLNAFINEVQAQSGKAITTLQADQLLAQTTQVKGALGCP